MKILAISIAKGSHYVYYLLEILQVLVLVRKNGLRISMGISILDYLTSNMVSSDIKMVASVLASEKLVGQIDFKKELARVQWSTMPDANFAT